jgi:hypothetical protein
MRPKWLQLNQPPPSTINLRSSTYLESHGVVQTICSEEAVVFLDGNRHLLSTFPIAAFFLCIQLWPCGTYLELSISCGAYNRYSSAIHYLSSKCRPDAHAIDCTGFVYIATLSPKARLSDDWIALHIMAATAFVLLYPPPSVGWAGARLGAVHPAPSPRVHCRRRSRVARYPEAARTRPGPVRWPKLCALSAAPVAGGGERAASPPVLPAAGPWQVLRLARPAGATLAAGIVGALCSAATGLASPAALGKMLDAVGKSSVLPAGVLGRFACVLLAVHVCGAISKFVEVYMLRGLFISCRIPVR